MKDTSTEMGRLRYRYGMSPKCKPGDINLQILKRQRLAVLYISVPSRFLIEIGVQDTSYEAMNMPCAIPEMD